MEIDWARMAVTAVIILVVLLAVNRTKIAESASRGKRALIVFVAVFIPLLLLNLFWPAGT